MTMGPRFFSIGDDISTISDPGLWVFPGGHVEWGEMLRECAAREMEEETCYRCHNLRSVDSPRDRRRNAFVSRENYDGRQPVACREGQGLEFVDRRKVESLPKQPYLTDVFDLASPPKSGSMFASGPQTNCHRHDEQRHLR